MNKLRRVVTVFNKTGDEAIVEEIELSDFDLILMQQLFSVRAENPMYDCYEITPDIGEQFRKRYGINFDFNKFIYFLEAYEN
ncbi:MAG: hypothetical protein H6625_00615 [Bdellovibrionaceae bacterium]|nr:hypothetical protein [Pseudobdellovibrionaceae bacterium]